MQPERFVTCGLVLRETDTRDADKILTVLTPDRGRLSVIARGARRKGSRVAAACQLLAYSEMTLYEKGRWTMLDAADTIELFDGLRQDLTALSLAALRYILYGDAKRLYSFALPQPGLRALDHASDAYVTAQLERSFRTLDYYKTILPQEETKYE